MSTLLGANWVEAAEVVPAAEMRHLGLIESLLESVLQQECGSHLVDLLRQLQSVCRLEGKAQTEASAAAAALVEQLDLPAAIRATRAFALYFQLINIVEQYHEQCEKKRRQRLPVSSGNGHGPPTWSYLEQSLAPPGGCGEFALAISLSKADQCAAGTDSKGDRPDGNSPGVYGPPDGNCAAYDLGVVGHTESRQILPIAFAKNGKFKPLRVITCLIADITVRLIHHAIAQIT